MTEDVIAGRYRLIDPIGTGGSGTVWRAVDLQQNRWCAAKLLRQRDAGELLRFVDQQRANVGPDGKYTLADATEFKYKALSEELQVGG